MRTSMDLPVRAVWLAFGALAIAGAGCSSNGAAGDDNGGGLGSGATSSGDAGVASCLSSNECPTGWQCNDFGTCTPPPPSDGGVAPPPEVEYTLGAPISSQRFVYVPMTAENELARIDGVTLAVTTTAVGKSPSVVAAIPGSDGAIVLDSINATATIVRPGVGGAADSVRVLGTLPNLNRLDVDPTGHFAVAWFDLVTSPGTGSGSSGSNSLTGIGSFQDVTVLALAPGAELAVDLTVGFRPRDVQFDTAGSRGYVITDDGVSVVDLVYATSHAPAIVPAIPVADPTITPTDLEVNIVASGNYAAVRQLNVATLRVVSLAGATAGQVWSIPLASAATDIDLAPDGSRVYAVERDAKLLAVVDIPGDAIDPTGVETVDLSDGTLGSLVLSPDGTTALLFTNATLDDRITFVHLDQPGYPHVTWPLKKAVRAVGISPTGTSAIVLAAKAPGDPSTATDVDDFIAKSYGYELIDLATGFAKLELTPVDPGPFAYSPDGTQAFLGLDGGDAVNATRTLEIANVQTGVVTSTTLGSPPAAIGILPAANAAFVSQRHPLGRVSFVELVDDSIRTVTGFDLNSHVVP